ncbi:hypothetical protein [Dactylosporangium sp. CA-233914]
MPWPVAGCAVAAGLILGGYGAAGLRRRPVSAVSQTVIAAVYLVWWFGG